MEKAMVDNVAANHGYYPYSNISSKFVSWNSFILFLINLWLPWHIGHSWESGQMSNSMCLCMCCLYFFGKSISKIMNWIHCNLQCWQWFLSLLCDSQSLLEPFLKIPLNSSIFFLRVCFHWWFLSSSTLLLLYIV